LPTVPGLPAAKVREVIKYGADFIKICASGGVLSKGDQPGTPQYTLEEMTAIAEEAHKLGRKVAAHGADGTQSIKDAIRAGIDSIEHSSLIDDEGIALAKQRGTYLVFDIYNDDYILQEGEKAGMLQESVEKEKKIGRMQREKFPQSVSSRREDRLRHRFRRLSSRRQRETIRQNGRVGHEAIDAIQAATISAADLIGLSGKAGSLESGYYADIIAVDGNPLETVPVLEKVKFVMKGGVVARNDFAAK